MELKKTPEEILKGLRIWIQKYVISWSGKVKDSQIIMFEELDKVFEDK